VALPMRVTLPVNLTPGYGVDGDVNRLAELELPDLRLL
jgi:hypothetical protein